MDHERPNPLDYAAPQHGPKPPHPAAFVTGIMLLLIGGLFFFVGVAAMGLDFRTGSFHGRSVAFAVAGAFICWAGMKLKSNRPA
jgi:hypothetical protein